MNFDIMEDMMKKLLIVDDQEMYLMSLAVALKKHYIVSTANNYSDAIEILEEKYDLALVDIRLDESDNQNVDGLKILEWCKINQPETVVFIMSAYTEFSYAEKALNLGARHFFRKPIDILDLLTQLREKG